MYIFIHICVFASLYGPPLWQKSDFQRKNWMFAMQGQTICENNIAKCCQDRLIHFAGFSRHTTSWFSNDISNTFWLRKCCFKYVYIQVSGTWGHKTCIYSKNQWFEHKSMKRWKKHGLCPVIWIITLNPVRRALVKWGWPLGGIQYFNLDSVYVCIYIYMHHI